MSDPHDLNRFIEAQTFYYPTAYKELDHGRKRSHWMWFIFPQFKGLGYTQRSQLYAIKSQAEAKAYLDHPVLGERLRECCQLLLNLKYRPIQEILGSPDDLKLKSSMTLFEQVSDETIFGEILEKYFEGKRDKKTINLI